MTIGDMKEPLTLQQETLTPDGGGGFARAWEDVAEVFARIEETGGAPLWKSRATGGLETFFLLSCPA